MESAIALNDPQAQAHIDAVVGPSERDLLLSKWYLVQNDRAKVGEALERAFHGMRTNPWTPLALGNAGLGLSEQIGRADPALAARLFEALALPFAVEALHNERLEARLRLARYSHDISRCVAAIGSLEPNFPWNDYLLETRLACYVKANDPRALSAEEDLRLFLELTGGLSGALASGPTTPTPALRPAARESAPVEDASVRADAAPDAAFDAARDAGRD
jgi:hypothetical protein